MLHIDYKWVLVALLFASLVMAKLFAGGRPFDTPVRRKRRFGYRGTEGPLRRQGPEKPPGPPPDPESEFFKES